MRTGLMALVSGLLALGLWALGSGALAEERGVMVDLPSGRQVEWLHSQTDASGPEGLTLRHFFVSRDLEGAAPEQALGDMQALCDSYALPRLSSVGPQPRQIVIALSDRAVAFGETDPEALQLFAAYAVSADSCEEQMF